MAYWIHEDGGTIGPLRMVDVLDRSDPDTLVSHGRKWVRLADHPDFGRRAAPAALSNISTQIIETPATAHRRQAPRKDPYLPCEDPSIGLAKGLIPTLCMFLFLPRKAFSALRRNHQLLAPVLYSLVILALVVGTSFVVISKTWTIANSAMWQGVTGGDPFVELFANEVLRAAANDAEYADLIEGYRSIPGAMLTAVVIALLGYMLLNLIRILVTHFILVRFGASQPYLPTTLRVALYSSTPNVLLVLFLLVVVLELVLLSTTGQSQATIVRPMFVFLIAAVWLAWTSFMEIAGFSCAYRLAPKETAIAVGIPHALVIAVIVFGGFLSMLVVIGAAMSA